MDMIIECFQKGELPKTTRQAIITLIPKKDIKIHIKDFRPISLTNIDFRIITLTYAQRLQKIIGDIISENQSAYIKKRYIGHNIRLLEDICYYCESQNKEGGLIALDFRKAFDSLDWNFIESTLKTFDFGENFQKFFRIIYNKPQTFIKNNGWVTEPFQMTRGIRQGCAVSALIFILCTEI